MRTTGTPVHSGDNRRRVAWRSQPGKTSLRVPVWHSNVKGEWREGLIRLPERLCHAAPNSNEAHERDRLFASNLQRWAEMCELKGWTMVSKPLIRGPVDPPVPAPGELPAAVDFDMKHYWALARFKRTSPLFVGLEDVLEMQRLADLYGIHPDADPLPWNDTTGTYDSGWVDPLKERAEHYNATGIKQSDYLLP